MSVKILAPDGVLRDNVVFSTTSTSRFITGTLPDNTVDVLVSLRGGAYSSDPTLVSFTGTEFIVPNPAAFPNGLDLFSGENVVGVVSVPLVGTQTAPATATIFLLPEQALVFSPPSSVTVERQDNAVTISALGLADTTITGYNFYGSLEPGGGTTGYTRLNVHPVTTPDKVENTTTLYSLVSKNPTVASNPLYLRAKIQQENEAGAVLETDVNSRVVIPQTVTEVETNITLSSLTHDSYYRFLHVRTANETSVPQTIFTGAFAALAYDLPLYYVVTAIYYDPTTQVEYESFFSTEVVGSPVNVRVQTTALPAVSRQQILENAIQSIYRQNPDIGVQPGAVIRDTFLDPFATEAERLRFLVDFMYRASSFDTLLQVDDPNGTGVSIPPANSAYKTALAAAFFLADPADVQPIIDGAFDKLASNFSVTRPSGVRSLGEVRFSTPLTPTRSLPIPLGTVVQGGGVQFRTTRATELPVDRAASYYNPTTRVYSVTVPIQAIAPGSQGDLGPRQINTGAPYGFSVVNDSATFGGKNAYSNSALAALARGALSSVDTGTTQGYLQGAASVAGVIQAQVVRSDDPLMQRDFDPETGTHLGGKVDVWSQGVRLAQVSDTFTFSYKRKQDVQFVVLGNPLDYVFQARDTSLSESNPLAEMLNYPTLNLGLTNITTGEVFDLTGVTILTYNTIQLSTLVAQPPVTLTDVVLGDYRYQTSNSYVFSRQPVSYVASVAGEVTGTLGTNGFYLYHPNSPLNLGRSTKAGDYLQIVPTATGPNPSGALVPITNELHVLTGFYRENVNLLGADSLTVSVTNTTGLVTYKGPWDPSGLPDYDIIEGTETTPLGIRRTHTSAITDGDSILVNYSHGENFVVTYQTNLVTTAVQDHIDKTEHATADALAKDAIQVPVDLTATVVLKRGYLQSTVDQAIRANLQYLVSGLRMGSPMRRSDVISAIDSTVGVSYVVVPLTNMSRAVGSTVAQDTLNTSNLGDTVRISDWSNPTTATWLLKQELSSPTTVGGGGPGAFRAVFQNDYQLTLQETNPGSLSMAQGRCYIIGYDGLIIPGYTDDATLIAQGYVTPTDIALARKVLTQNRVLVSVPVGGSPSGSSYWSTYVVGKSAGDTDIVTTTVEYIVLGNVVFTYTEEKV